MKLFTYGTDATECFEQLEKECEENFGDLDFKVVKKGEQYYISFVTSQITYIKIKVVRNGGGGMFGTPWFNMSLIIDGP